MIVRLKHVKRVRAKGRTYWYHRITGERLPTDHEERAARVLKINNSVANKAPRNEPGSLSDIITQYKQAPEYRGLTTGTRREYAIYLDLLSEKWGALPVTTVERHHILALRDKYAKTPGKANKIVTVLRILLTFSIDRDYRRDNPARDIKKLKMGAGHVFWPDEAIERFLQTAPPMMTLALKLGLYTGQRLGDVLAMSWHDYDGDWIQVVQSKTGTKLSIRVHRVLKEALDGQDRVSPIILTTETGRPFTGSNFRHHFGKARKAAGLVGLTFHGLRYTAASKLFEIGCTPSEVASLTGHKSLAMLTKYGRFADQKRLVKGVILRWERNGNRTNNGKPR